MGERFREGSHQGGLQDLGREQDGETGNWEMGRRSLQGCQGVKGLKRLTGKIGDNPNAHQEVTG